MVWEEYKRKNAHAFKREMALHQIQNHDPYSTHRQHGEADDITDKLRKQARKQPNPVYFVQPKE